MAGDLQGHSQDKWHHMLAFAPCMGVADGFIRDRCRENKLAPVVAEDLQKMRKQLRAAASRLTRTPMDLDPTGFASESSDMCVLLPKSSELRVERIVDTIHFTEKSESPILQVADACAYGLRRYLSGQPHGENFARSIFGCDDLNTQSIRPNAGSTGAGVLFRGAIP
jgi:hypothetical protein